MKNLRETTAWAVLALAILIGLALLTVSPAEAQITLPLGTWTLNSNGFEGDLNITAVDAEGNLTGNLSGGPFNEQITGFWNEAAQKIVFIRIPGDPAVSGQYQINTGYLFTNPLPSGIRFTLTGSFEAFQGSAATAARHVFGWFAQMDIILN